MTDAPLLDPDEALARLLRRARLTGAETVTLVDATGRALVERELLAEVDVPGFANSAMDGYALRAADTPGTLALVGESAAGSGEPPPVRPGTAVRIMTGAPLPAGADAVVPVEEASEADGAVTVAGAAQAGAHVRPAGHDLRAGERVALPPLATPAAIALLASLGRYVVAVRRRPRVAVLSTGDELAAPGTSLAAGQIHDANGPALGAAVILAGGELLALPPLPDEPVATAEALRAAAAAADLVVTSGGVSVGRHDHVRAVLEAHGTLDFWRIAVQPGKPLAVGQLDGTTVIGLPGNPVSALVTFELFVRPFIRAALGLEGDGRTRASVEVDERMTKDPARRAYLRVTVDGEASRLVARPSGGQGSAQVRPLASANALLVVPEGEAAAVPGRRYEAIILDLVMT